MKIQRIVIAILSSILLLPTLLISNLPLEEKSSSTAEAQENATPDDNRRPNIIVIMTDDQRWDTIKYMPNVSNLAAQGITFTNSFVTTSLCCPSRATFLTGQYAHNHGIWDNDPPFGGAAIFDDSSTLAVWLQNSGYRTALIGKYLNGYDAIAPYYVPPGWDDWQVLDQRHGYFNYTLSENGKRVPYGIAEKDYFTDVIKDKAIEFIRNNSTSGPFFLWLTPYAPHTPEIPASRHSGTCQPDHLSIARPPSYNEPDVSDKPYWVADNPSIPLLDVDRAQICTLKAVDEAVGAIIDALGPEINNTVVIFTSDNGFLWGEHRLRAKTLVYEEAIRVPLIIYHPEMTTLSTNATIDKLVANIDLAPTIAELASASVDSQMDGMSLLRLLENIDNQDSVPWRDKVFIEQTRDEGFTRINASAVRTSQFKLVQHVDHQANTILAREFYDLTNDPYELENSINNTQYAQVIGELSQLLVQPIPNEPDGRQATLLTLNVIPAVPSGTNVTITGLLTTETVTGEAGTPLANAPIAFDGTGAGNLQDLTTGPDGTFIAKGKASDIVRNNWSVQAHFAGNSENQALDSVMRMYSTTREEPEAVAGPDQEVTGGAMVTLDGTASFDSNPNTIFGFTWTQTAGPGVGLSDSRAGKPTFTAPTVTADTALTFSLIVNDGQNDSGESDDVTVLVKSQSAPYKDEYNIGTTVKGSAVDVEVKTTSTITGFTLDEEREVLSFQTSSDTGSEGVTEISIGRILEGPYIVTIDGEVTTDFAVGSSATRDNTIMISYSPVAHEITITGTNVVPEFPLFSIGTVAGTMSIVVVVVMLFRTRLLFRSVHS